MRPRNGGHAADGCFLCGRPARFRLHFLLVNGRAQGRAYFCDLHIAGGRAFYRVTRVEVVIRHAAP